MPSAILAENTLRNGSAKNVGGSIQTGSSYNIIGLGGSGGLVNGTDGNIVLTAGQTAGLAPLGDYGGPTKTHALLQNSPAIDSGDDLTFFSAGLITDQRGSFRSVGRADIGAYEFLGPVESVNASTWNMYSKEATAGFSHGWDLPNVDRLVLQAWSLPAGMIRWARPDGFLVDFEDFEVTSSADDSASRIEVGATPNDYIRTDKFGNQFYYHDFSDEDYTYDGLHRLKTFDRGDLAGTFPNYTGISGTPAKEEDYTLDQLGNWPGYATKTAGTTDLNQGRAHNKVNEIDVDDDHANTPGASITAATGTNWYDPSYDAAGNMTAIPQPAAPTSSFSLKYDAWNRLIEVKDGSNVVQQNEYGGSGRRIVRSVYSSGSLSHRIHYYYNEQWQLLEDRIEVSGIENPDPLSQYVWHPYYIDALTVRFYDENVDGASVEHYYLQDANFNVTAITDNAGGILERYAYSPYGKVTFLNPDFSLKAQQASSIGNTHLYTGRERDPETGLQLNRKRFYACHLGRWVTRDPIGYEGSQWNLYEYGLSHPVVTLDPLGLESCDEKCKRQCSWSDMPTVCHDPCMNNCKEPPAPGGGAMAAVGAGFTVDVATPEPTDLCIPKWVGWGIIAIGAGSYAIYKCCTKKEEEKKCRPCTEISGPLPAPEYHPGVPAHGCEHGHYHYYEYHQAPWPSCKCRKERRTDCLDESGKPIP